MCNCIHELLNVFEGSAQRERTIMMALLTPCNVASSFQFSVFVSFMSLYIIAVSIARTCNIDSFKMAQIATKLFNTKSQSLMLKSIATD